MNNLINKIKYNLKQNLRSFIDLDTLERNMDSRDIHNKERISLLERENALLRHSLRRSNEKIEALHNTLSNVVSMGSDIAPYGRGQSWAVVCVEGKYNVVKFYDLSQKDGREMLEFLKRFEGGRYVNDTPIGFFPKNMFIDW